MQLKRHLPAVEKHGTVVGLVYGKISVKLILIQMEKATTILT